jgi:NADH-quinone oxidoreductase subunit M
LGIILAAAYMLWMVQRVAFGVPSQACLPKLHDLSPREMAILAPLVVLVFWIGLFPNPLLTRMHASVEKVIARAAPPTPATATQQPGESEASTFGVMPHPGEGEPSSFTGVTLDQPEVRQP